MKDFSIILGSLSNKSKNLYINEFGQRVSDALEDIHDEMNHLEWYKFSLKTKETFTNYDDCCKERSFNWGLWKYSMCTRNFQKGQCITIKSTFIDLIELIIPNIELFAVFSPFFR